MSAFEIGWPGTAVCAAMPTLASLLAVSNARAQEPVPCDRLVTALESEFIDPI